MKKPYALLTATVCFGLSLLIPAAAQAQYGRYPMGTGMRGRGYVEMSSSLRLDVSPRDAEVFVDGYRAGVVDDFDGVFQRLNVRPGEHEVVFYMPGFKTERRNLYLSPLTDQKIKFQMVALRAGERPEPPPEPTDQPQLRGRGRGVNEPPGQRGRGRAMDEPPPPDPARFGTLSIRVVPANADVIVDGERWRNSNALAPLTLEVSVGRHRIQVTREGYETYESQVDIKVGETTTLNISLKRR